MSGSCERNFDKYSYGYPRRDDWSDDENDDESDDESDDENDEHHSITDEEQRLIRLKIVVLPDGSKYAQDVDIEIENVLQGKESFRGEPSKEKYDDCYTTHYYRGTCLLIIPKDSQDDLLFEGVMRNPIETKKLLSSLKEDVQASKSSGSDPKLHESSQSCRARLTRFCKHIIAHYFAADKSIYEDIVLVALSVEDPSLFFLVVNNKASNKAAHISLSTYQEIGLALSSNISTPVEWLEGTAVAVKSSRMLHEMWARLSAFMKGFKENQPISDPFKDSHSKDVNSHSVDSWLYSIITTNLQVQDSKDALALAEIILGHEQCEQFLINDILPCFKGVKVKKELILVFLGSIYKSYKEDCIGKETAKALYRHIIRNLLPELFEVSDIEANNKRLKSELSKSYTCYRPWPVAQDLSEHKLSEIADHTGRCLELGLKEEVNNILSDMVRKHAVWSVEAIAIVWIPFLQRFIVLVNTLPGEELGEYSRVFGIVIENYIRRYLGVEPPRPFAPTLVKHGCGCNECNELDRFILDPLQQTGSFRYKKAIRLHLEQRILRDVKYTTQRGSPLTLCITKNAAEYAAKRAVADYRKRCDYVRRDLISIGLPALNKMLGTAGEELVDFKSVRNPLIASGAYRTPPANLPQSTNIGAPPPLTQGTSSSSSSSAKPLVECIDLTKSDADPPPASSTRLRKK